jgi:glycerophosphoryl diester phosphodiesterase
MKKILFLAALIFSASSLMAQTEVIAHRGFHAKQGANSANNTISSLQHAQDLGVYGSEVDINETKDGKLVAVHGPKHRDYVVQNTDFAVLRATPVINGEKLPTLEEYLLQAKTNTKTKLIIEIKSHDTPERETRVVKKILAEVKRLKMTKHVEYIAFSKHVCDEVVKYAPKKTKIAYLNGDLTPQQCKDNGYTGIDYNIGVMQKNPEWIKQSQALGLTVNVWTVNDTERIQWCIDQKVDYITTDNPEEVKRLLAK